MAKQQMYQQFIYKISSERIIKADKNLKLTLKQARENEEIISLADSNCLRMIDEMNEIDRNNNKHLISEIHTKIKEIQKQPKSIENRRDIKHLYSVLDKIQFKADYVAIVLKNKKHFDILNKGFKINGIEYKRFVGTSNGSKKNTIVYVAVKNSNGIYVHSELSKRAENGRDTSKPLIAGKYEAYKSLMCSASTPVSMPKGILLVNDIETTFNEDVISLDDTHSDEPIMDYVNQNITLNGSDGLGLISPELAERWSAELQDKNLASAFCIRNAFCKGIVATFDFQDFNDKFSKLEYVTDIYGDKIKVQDVELVLTTSMLKLWNCYSSMNDYLSKCNENGFTFAVTKVLSGTLESERHLNYQFIQAYTDLTDSEIEKLCQPTISRIKNILHEDVVESLKYLTGNSNKDINDIKDNVIKALMINKSTLNDSFIINRLYYLIKKRISETKKGVLDIRGNYGVIIGDPYALCQHIFMDIKSDLEYGLLKANEIYSQYWNDLEVNSVVCLRAPMSVHNNIRKVKVVDSNDMRYWYKYISCLNILNVHDSICMAMNGADFDGDAIISTDNEVLLNNTLNLPSISCVQKKANPTDINETTLIQANKNSFGSDIGTITNRITSMYAVQSNFDKNSDEYKRLSYRIACGQQLQQNAIDKVKGIISKPMPNYWYDNKYNLISDNDDETTIKNKELNSRIVADKKPYFMIYVYPDLNREYKNFEKTVQTKSIIEFNKPIDELDIHNEKEKMFLEWYQKKTPVNKSSCTMNKVCWHVEHQLDDYVPNVKQESDFDYTLYKSNVEYDVTTYYKISDIYKKFNKALKEIIIMNSTAKMNIDELNMNKSIVLSEFIKQCYCICPNRFELCDIIIDLCYTKENSKKFAWTVVGNTMIDNLKANSEVI